jgi:catalase (peroxidase I)
LATSNRQAAHQNQKATMSLDEIKADIKAIVAEKSCGPIFIRLSWHDAGVYSTGKLTGGCPNAAMRFTDGGEGTFGANAGLPDVGISFLKPVTDKYVSSGVISNADLWTLAANVAIEAMGGPAIPTRFGRTDAKSSAESVESQVGRLPDGDKGIDHLREIFHPKGFTDKDIVALSGAHTVGKCHADRSGFDGKWTEDHLSFNNGYFKEMLAKEYADETTAQGCPQKKHGASGTIMLISDLALLDAPFREFVDLYAKDQEAFFKDFVAAWVKLQENGCEGLRDTL